MMVQEKFHKRFIPKSATTSLPKPILDYRTPDSLSARDLHGLCEQFKMPDLTPAPIAAVERETRKHAASRIWFRQRAGRITASKLKQAIRTNADRPAKSLIKAIC